MNIGISDDYASLDAGDYHFYYGYEVTDDDDNWMFEIRKHGKVIFLRKPEDLGCKKFDDTAEVLLAGIGKFIDERAKA